LSYDTRVSAVTGFSGQTVRLVRLVALTAVLLIPVRILGRGYLPSDDALRHAAKSASGRTWSEILVLRPEIEMDSHPGWHAVLRGVHLVTGWGAHPLVLFSVAALFVLLSLAPLLLLRRPEAWLLALLAGLIADPQLVRLMLGRPFLVTEAALILVCLLWPTLEGERLDRRATALLVAALTGSAWLHGSPYLWLLPAAAFFLARRARAGVRFSACLLVGVLVGALMTGSPVRYLVQQLVHGALALGGDEASVTLVGEFQPFAGVPMVVGLVLALMIWRASRGRSNEDLLRDPVFMLALLGWALGFVAVRFHSDWAAPALLVLVAREVETALEEGDWAARARLGLASAAAAVLFLAFTADTGSRWTSGLGEKFLARDNPQHAPWLPEPGGILYSADMTIFYRTFFRNPEAPWRYILGFEPGWMPQADLETYREIRRSKGATESYAPWVEKMRREDRLLIKLTSNTPPQVPGLEWYQVEFSLWSGRLPKTPPPSPPPPAAPAL
jgi:hypothetical protein